MKIADLDRLTFAMHSARGGYALLLGSGVSRAAGILTGWEVVGDLVKRLAVARGAGDVTDPYVWYRDECGTEPSYSELLAALAPSPTDRQQLLRQYFEPTAEDRRVGRKVPTKAHHAIAQLAARGYVRVIITTNFDALVEGALEAAGVAPVTVSTPDQVEGLPSLRDVGCLIVKPHGDYRDARIKNTPDELAAFDPRMDALLSRLLEDHGLVVCGWSADWDLALRAAVERARVRGAVYWTMIASLSVQASRLVALKLGRTIEVSSADDFFERVANRLGALDQYGGSHAVSLEALLAQAKLYLSEPRFRIQLADLVRDEVEEAARGLGAAEVFSPKGSITYSTYVDLLQNIDAVTERVVTLAAVVSFWGDGSHAESLARGLIRLTANAPQGSGALAGLWFYPALRIVYAIGLAAVAARNYTALAVVESLDVVGPVGNHRRWFASVDPYTVLEGVALQKQTNSHAPATAWFAKSMAESYERVVGPAPELGHTLDYFECLSAMLQADAAGEDERPFLLGRFMLASRRPRSAMSRLKSELESEAGWPPLLAGLLGGNQLRAKAAMARVEEATETQSARLGW